MDIPPQEVSLTHSYSYTSNTFSNLLLLCECLNVSIVEYIGVYAKQKHISIYSYNKYYIYRPINLV